MPKALKMKKTLSLGKEDHSDGTLTGKEGKIRVLIQNIVKHLHLVGRPTHTKSIWFSTQFVWVLPLTLLFIPPG